MSKESSDLSKITGAQELVSNYDLRYFRLAKNTEIEVESSK